MWPPTAIQYNVHAETCSLFSLVVFDLSSVFERPVLTTICQLRPVALSAPRRRFTSVMDKYYSCTILEKLRTVLQISVGVGFDGCPILSDGWCKPLLIK